MTKDIVVVIEDLVKQLRSVVIDKASGRRRSSTGSACQNIKLGNLVTHPLGSYSLAMKGGRLGE